jgi:palmitoyltransferase
MYPLAFMLGENVSWHKISYLKDIPEEIGSPFSRGTMSNIRHFCRIRVPRITLWEFNQEALRIVKP